MSSYRLNNTTKPDLKRRKPLSRKPTSTTASESTRLAINPLKKRRRDLVRLLQHAETLPADIRIGYERELASCNSDLETAQHEARRSQMIKKYHMVRFFERKKATRLLKKARQRLAQATSTSPNPSDEKTTPLTTEIHIREVDLNYTLFFPLDEVYSSLYAAAASKKSPKTTSNNKEDENPILTTSSSSLEEEKVNRTDPMWLAVEAAMARGQLQLLRDGKLRKTTTPPTSVATPHILSAAKPKPKPRAREKEKEKPKEEKSTRMKLLERQDQHAQGVTGVSRLARRERRAQEREQKKLEEMSEGDEEDGAGFFES